MKKRSALLLSAVCAIAYTAPVNAALPSTLPKAMDTYRTTWEKNYVPDNLETMWYYSDWSNNTTTLGTEGSASSSFLIGNGQLGGCVSGNGWRYLKLNEKGLFAGKPEINDWKGYQDFGTVIVKPGKDLSTGFLHQLDLTTGLYSSIGQASTWGQYNPEPTGVLQWFASYPDQVIAGYFGFDTPGFTNLEIELTSKQNASSTARSIDSQTAEVEFSGTLSGELVSYAACMRIVATGGTVTASGSSVKVADADNVLILIAAATDYDSSSPTFLSGTEGLPTLVEKRVADASALGWETLYDRHVADHQALYNSMRLEIDGRANTTPTGELLKAYTTGAVSQAQARQHENMVFNYGRYLMIAAARPVKDGKGMDAPTNLQGIWAHDSKMWNCDIHTNINVEMNYWPAEVTNLSDNHLTFCNWIINLSQSDYWKWLAKEYLAKDRNATDLDGNEWTSLMAMNPFGGGTTYDTNGTYNDRYNAAQAWMCSHLIQHYLYTLDEEYLSRALPVLWRACRFWVRNMDRKEENGGYVYEIPQESSPENNGGSGPATAHTQQLVTYLFKHTLNLLESHPIAEATREQIADLQEKYDHLDRGLNIWMSDGKPYLREWKYTDTFGEANHRHLSHLVCMYPLDLVSTDEPDIYEATINAMEQRGLKCGAVDAAVWTTAWKTCLWARAHSQNAFKVYSSTIGYQTESEAGTGLFYNLTALNQCMQMEGNWGLTAGVAEMLVQSHAGFIDILPALPAEWSTGKATGLKAIGNFTVDIEWASGSPKLFKVTSVKGGTFRLKRSVVEAYSYIYRDNMLLDPSEFLFGYYSRSDADELIEFDCAPGETYTLSTTKIKQEGTTMISDLEASALTISNRGHHVTIDGGTPLSVEAFSLQGIALPISGSLTDFTLPGAATGVVIVRVIDQNRNTIVKKLQL